jgi:hypothetical protein
LDLYTGFPYEHETCGDVTDVAILDQWRLRNGTFIHNAKLFPLKITDNLHGCQVRVASIGIPTYSTDSDGNVVYKLGGLVVQNLLLAVDKMNVIVAFLKPSLRITVMEVAYEAGSLVDRRSDIVIVILPLQATFLTPWFQQSIPYEYNAAKWFVPCPQPIERMQQVMHTYQIPVRLTMATLLVLTAILWWDLANWRHSSLKDSRTFQTLSYCLYNVSAKNTPNTWKFRFLFLVYLYYCFAMSTVFQAIFTSYLVEPGYGEKYETFDDLLHSSVAYGYNYAVEGAMTGTSYKEHQRFPYWRRHDCNDVMECMIRIANNDRLCTVSAPRISQNLASESGIRDASKSLCTLEESVFTTTGLTLVLNNGSPFLNRLNALTRRSLEGGLLDRY